MAYTTNVLSNNLVGRELGIASTFVKQYYTLLNKAPCFIHNFYSQDSTFIHGTIEMANEHYTEPVVGREKIRRKMEDLKLNDCRAKIKQIDCLETLAGGLVIQVIGELSNNGRPMRRFLQTFVLAPSPDETSRQDGDPNARPGANSASLNNSGSSRAGPGSNEANHNQKFFVLNSIFRYQDDGPDSEFEDDAASSQANTSVEGAVGNEFSKVELNQQHHRQPQSAPVYAANTNYTLNGAGAPSTATEHHQNNISNNKRRQPDNSSVGSDVTVDRLASDLDTGLRLDKPNQENDLKRDFVSVGGGGQANKVATGATSGHAIDKKGELHEKISENSKTPVATQNINDDGPQAVTGPAVNSANASTNQNTPSSAVRIQPSNEPKTWANMVRTSYQPPASTSVSKQPNTISPIAHTGSGNTSGGESQTQPLGQASTLPPQQLHSQQQLPTPQQQPQNTNNNANANNRRRHDKLRKPSTRATGRTIKNRPRPPQAPVMGTPAGKPVA